MKKLICLIGKSGSGKDSIMKEILKQTETVKPIIRYTTRPVRPGEKEGVEYHFVGNEKFDEMDSKGEFLITSSYDTEEGEWKYAIPKIIETEDIGIIIITPEEFQKFKNQKEVHDIQLYPYYLSCDEEIRIMKLFEREQRKRNPNYMEIKRRVKTDNQDFKEIEKDPDISIIYNDFRNTPEEIASEFLYCLRNAV